MSLDELTDYARRSYQVQQHHERFRRYVEAMPRKLICQECGGGGGETVAVLDYGQGPFEECGFCEGTGLVTPWLRGLWLRWKKSTEAKRYA